MCIAQVKVNDFNTFFQITDTLLYDKPKFLLLNLLNVHKSVVITAALWLNFKFLYTERSAFWCKSKFLKSPSKGDKIPGNQKVKSPKSGGSSSNS